MLTAVQRAEILALTADSGLDSSTATDENIWYDFLSSLFGAGQDVEGSEAEQVPAARDHGVPAPGCFCRAAHVRRPQRASSSLSGAVEHPDWRIGTAITAEFSI